MLLFLPISILQNTNEVENKIKTYFSIAAKW